jgi:hypothetical protein
MRTQIFKHTKLSNLFSDREETSKEINAVIDEMMKLEKSRDKIAIKLQKQKEKMIPLIEKDIIPNLTLTEFEEVGKITKIEGGIEIEIVDKVEEFKANYLEQKKTKSDGK